MENKNTKEKCPRYGECPMCKHFKMESTLKTFEQIYCLGKYENCKRWEMLQKDEEVPEKLLPNGQMLS